MSRPSLATFVEAECVPRLSAAAVYQDVKFANRRPHYLQGMCPFAAGKTPPGSFVVDARTLRWSCLHHCRRGGQSVLAYLNGGKFPRPDTGEVKASIEKLAQIAEIPLARLPPITPDVERQLAAQERVASLLETFFVQTRRLLHSTAVPARQPAVAVLARYGLDVGRLEDNPFGQVTDMPAVHAGLEEAGYSDQEIEASSLARDERLAGRLIGPIRDRFGRILSFWARDPHDRHPKFLFKGPWKEEISLVGLDTAFAAAGPDTSHLDELLVFERLFDALVLHGLGFPQAAAIAGPASDMTPARWQRLGVLGVRRVTLVPDDSESSCHNVLAAVENAFRAESAPAVRVLSPEVLGRHHSGVALARARGVAEFQSALEAGVVYGYHYKALSILRKHQPHSGWTDPSRHAAWKEAIEVYATSAPKTRPQLDAHFVPAIEAGLQRSWETFQPLQGCPEMGTRSLLCEQSRDTTHNAGEPLPVSRQSPSPTSTERLPFERSAPRPPISRPMALPCASQEGAEEELAMAGHLALGLHSAMHRGRRSQNGLNGYCRIHHCETTSCFCFD